MGGRSSDVFKLREAFEGGYGALPSEVAPRMLLIGDFPAGRKGLQSPPPGAGLSLNDLIREYGDGNADYNLDFARVFASRSTSGIRPSGFDIYNIKSGAATDAVSAAVTDADGGSPVSLFKFKAIGPGSAYNGLTTTITVTRMVTGHPAHPTDPVAVCSVEIMGPNPDSSSEVFDNIVFTEEGSLLGNSGVHRTRDASIINDPLVGSRYQRLAYEATAGASHFGANRTVGDQAVATLAGGGNGNALTNTDWTNAISAVSGIPFRWFTIANPPSATARAALHSTLKVAPFRLVFLNQMYGESISDFITDVKTYGNLADDGTSAAFFGWGSHPAADGREVAASAAYLGEWSAKIAAAGLGGSYPVGNQGLGFRAIAAGDGLTKTQMENAADAGINYIKQLEDGTYGVHGYYTRDDQLDRMGDLGVRSVVNDIARRLARAFTPLAHNRPNNVITRATIDRLGNQAILPYVNVGAVRRAATGTFDLMEVQSRWQGVSFPSLPGWAVFMASLSIYGTLGGIFAHLTDVEIEGLNSIAGGGGGAAASASASGGGSQ